ncbi:MAG: DUF2460 domain-containing protein [Planctomycetota bacterium]|jgi:uncharacterized protein (TIGR02217 family)
MAVFPSSTSVPYGDPVSIGMRFKTLVSNFDELGEEKRKQKWTYPKREVTLKYNAIGKDEAQTLWKFYQARAGSYNAFVWFESTGYSSTGFNSYVDEYVGTGDSTTLVFNLPAINSSGTHKLYIAGTSQPTSNYTFSAGGGPDGEDKITVVSTSTGGPGPPTSTERITYDFTGRLKVRCRFAEDVFTFENFYDRLCSAGITLRGVLNS